MEANVTICRYIY